MSDVEWSEPPDRRTGQKGKWDEVAQVLRGNPGKWALIARKPSYSASSVFVTAIRQAKTKTWAPAGSFDARSSRIDEDTVGVWACSVGGPQ